MYQVSEPADINAANYEDGLQDGHNEIRFQMHNLVEAAYNIVQPHVLSKDEWRLIHGGVYDDISYVMYRAHLEKLKRGVKSG